MRVVRSAVTAAVAVAVACGGNGTAPPDQGSFQATVSGDLSLSLSGTALFGTEGADFEGFGIALTSGQVGQNNSDLVLIARDNTARPVAGTYDILEIAGVSCPDCTADDFTSIYWRQLTAVDVAFLTSVSGTLTIDESAAEQVSGSFTFTASALVSSGDLESVDSVMVQGTFRAVPGTIPSPL